MADQFKREEVEKVAQYLDKYAQDSQLATLENLAKVALFQDKVAADKAQARTAAASTGNVPAGKTAQLHAALAASVGLGRS